nr:aminoacyl-histidine dipeptidase [uncultured Terrisporobacter sp.]
MKIEDLKPQLVFKYFSEICKIPRGSGNEKQISNYLTREGKKLGLEVVQDEHYNVLIKKKATPGYENAPTVIIQGHMDMVCEKNKGTDHDFKKDPIKLRVEGNYLYATDTTLGADNGIAVAMGLALLASDNIVHPPLEVVFTADEEESMNGAMNLKGDLFKGSYIINLDSEVEGTITVSCAGGVTALVTIEKEFKDVNSKVAFNIDVKGLLGGHSGMEINKQRANSNILMGRILNHLLNHANINLDLVQISGGAKNNAIPREADAVILIDEKDEEILKEELNKILNIFKNEFKTSDPKIEILCEKSHKTYNEALKDDIRDKIIATIILMPCGIQTMSMDIENLVESSTNLGVINNNKDNFLFEFATRSSVKSLKDEINNKMSLLCKTLDVKLSLEDDYPEWEYAKDSKLEEICINTYEELTGQKPEISAIHAGLECGLLLDAIKGAQAVSIGPNLYDVHTPNEHLDIKSTNRTWNYLLAILKNIK